MPQLMLGALLIIAGILLRASAASDEGHCHPSPCGSNAKCKVVNGLAKCSCKHGFVGDALSGCHQSCVENDDCPAESPHCAFDACRNPCENACGVGADCKLRGSTPVCSCPRDMIGDPFSRCRPFTKEDLCMPNPCGDNALCKPGYDKSGRMRPVCDCPNGHTGNPLKQCMPILLTNQVSGGQGGSTA